ncbi:MAG: ROK family glucokinase [Ruminococcaceae bacterium]|nr:ROK family glucokinase [Oscillospiraceae bacterium]
MYYLGIDLGGTNIAAAVVNEKYEIVGKASLKTNCPRPAEEIAEDMYKAGVLAIENSGLKLDDIAEVGVGSPGSVDHNTGFICFANNLGFHNVPLGDMLEAKFGRRVFLENDANAAAYGELLAGAGRGAKQFVAITLGTGVGGGVIVNGQIISGMNYAGGELGHIVIVKDGEPCSCGRNGCWESYASATALIRQTKAAMELDKNSKMWEVSDNGQHISGRTAFDAMRLGDETATKVVKEFCDYVACGLTNIINIFQPEVACIGGGISKEGETLVAPIRDYINREVYSKNSDKQTVIKAAELGNNAGIIGAAFLGNLYR